MHAGRLKKRIGNLASYLTEIDTILTLPDYIQSD